jgi:NADH dehydrogenase
MIKEVNMSTILVVGATGWLGSAICQKLAAAGKSVRGLVRSTSDLAKVERLKSSGVETVQGDVREPASLEEACKNIDAVISTVSSVPFSYQPGINTPQTTDLDGITNLIEAAKANHVSHFTFTSFTKNINLDFPLSNAKREAERRLRESGLEYTILRPGYFMEAWLSPVVGFDVLNAKVAIYGSGQNPVSWIAVQDVAQYAIASLEHPKAKNVVLELGGPEAISPLEVVKCFEQASGRSMELQFVPEAALEAQQAAATDPMQQSFSGLMRCLAAGDSIDMSETQKAFNIPPTPLDDYVQRVLTAS